MELREPGPSTSADNLSEANSEDSEMSFQIVVNKPISEASLTSKMVRKPEDSENIYEKNHEKTKKKRSILTRRTRVFKFHRYLRGTQNVSRPGC